MSTKQTVIFIFMILFLGIALFTLGAWFHYSLELDIKKKALAVLDKKNLALKDRERKVKVILDNIEDPDQGLRKRVEKQRELADAKYQEVYAGDIPRKRLYEEKKADIEKEWERVGKEWKSVASEWGKRNAQIRQAIESLNKTLSETEKRKAQAREELANELKNENVQRKKLTREKKTWEEHLSKVRYEGEVVLDKINSVMREFERTAHNDADGVIIHSDPDLDQVTVNLGYQHGVRRGMKFRVFSGRHTVPVLKGRIMLARVGATSSLAVVLPRTGRPLVDPNTGWVAPDPKMRFSIFSSSGSEGTEPQPLEKLKTKKDLVQEIRRERFKQEQGLEEVPGTPTEAPTVPPLVHSKAFSPIVAGDWIANTEFERIVPERQFHRQVTEELLSLKDINLGTLTFFLADTIRPFRQEFLKRLCERNRSKVAPVMSSDVDYIVTTASAARIDLLEESLRPYKEKADVTPDIAHKRKVLAALKKGKIYSARVILEDELEAFFQRRRRKAELAKGKTIQPGQHRFYVVGETRLRSVRETGLYIRELGGVLAPKLDASVDYLVVGGGLADAKLDPGSGRVYYPGQKAPPTARPFYEAVKKMGLRILREAELASFFGRK